MDLGIETRNHSGNCQNHGNYETIQSFLGGGWRGGECPHCVDERQGNTDREELIKRHGERVEILIKKSGIPDRYLDKDLSTYIPENDRSKKHHESLKRYVSDFKAHRATGVSICMVGGVGTGKTHLGTSIVLETIRLHEVKSHYTTVTKLIRRIRDTFHQGRHETETHVLDYFISRDLLVIDEIGIQSGSDYEHNTMFEIINERYSNKRPTIIISNLGVNELVEVLGERVIDRFKDGGAILNFDWESYRGKKS